MASLDDLPNEVLHQILLHCTQSMLYRLLKSKIVAHLAYMLLFKHVEIEPRKRTLPLLPITRSYIDSIDPFPRLSTQLAASEPIISYSFVNASELISFYRSHPLFRPHTLTYYWNADLAELEYYEPGLLKKIKHLNGKPFLFDEIKFDVSHLNHDILRLPKGCSASQYPQEIHTLLVEGSIPDIIRPSVKEIKILEDSYITLRYKNFPNLRKLELWDKVAGTLNIPTLESLRIEADEVDLTSLKNLKEAFIRTSSSGSKVGYFNDYKIQLPKNLQKLELISMYDARWLGLEYGEALKELSITFKGGMEIISRVDFPPNLERLAIVQPQSSIHFEDNGIELLSHDQEFPESIKSLTLNGFKQLQNPILPPNVSALNLLRCNFEGIDFSSFPNLVSLQVDKAIEFPPQLEYLQTKKNGDNNHIVINDLKSLKYADIVYHKWYPNRPVLSNIEVPPLMTNLVLENAYLSTFTGGRCLTKLNLHNCKTKRPLVLTSLESLRALIIRNDLSMDGTKIYFQDLDIPVLPSTLESLVLTKLVISKSFTCPSTLKYIEISECTFLDSHFTSNEGLEALIIRDSTLEMFKVFQHASSALHTVSLTQCHLGTLVADFTNTRLSRFLLGNSSYYGKKVKFPRCLKVGLFLESRKSFSQKRAFLDWADLSLCNQMSQFICSPRLFVKEGLFTKITDKIRMDEFNKKIPEMMEKLGDKVAQTSIERDHIIIRLTD